MIAIPPRVAQNLIRVRTQITEATIQTQRPHDSVSLVAVTKTRSIAEITDLLYAGQRCFGENRVQEAARKYKVLREQWPTLELHLIGTLQTNKTRLALQTFNVISTLDRPELAYLFARLRDQGMPMPRLRIEVNIGREPQKGGVFPESFPSFIVLCRDTLGLPIEGLMTIPPHTNPPRPFFEELRRIADHHDLPVVSMGMSEDFGDAIACGSTEIRIGRALFVTHS